MLLRIKHSTDFVKCDNKLIVQYVLNKFAIYALMAISRPNVEVKTQINSLQEPG